MSLFGRLATAFNAAEHFGNPLQIAAARLFRKPSECITVVDRASGVRCLCTLNSHHMFSEVWYTRSYDVSGVPIRPGDIVLDIGANQGFFSCYAAYKGAKVFAFEPVPELFERLLFNVRRNGFADRVTAFPYAIGESDADVEIQVSASLGGGQSSIIPEFTKYYNVPVRQSIKVPCRTLPKILADLSAPTVRLCKLDVEGAEFGILRTLKASHLEKLQSIAVEYHLGACEIRDLLSMIEGWGSHHTSLMDQRPYDAGYILRCAHKGMLDIYNSAGSLAESD
jgi:FkbM family methyltransferase